MAQVRRGEGHLGVSPAQEQLVEHGAIREVDVGQKLATRIRLRPVELQLGLVLPKFDPGEQVRRLAVGLGAGTFPLRDVYPDQAQLLDSAKVRQLLSYRLSN